MKLLSSIFFLLFSATALAADCEPQARKLAEGDRIRCWKGATGLDNFSAAMACNSPDPDKFIRCWKGASGVDNFSAAILCGAEDTTMAIRCWRGASGVDSKSAALLCVSKDSQKALRCWRGASGFDSLSAATICADPIGPEVAAKLKTIQEAEEEETRKNLSSGVEAQ
jgi:hypothetical protein